MALTGPRLVWIALGVLFFTVGVALLSWAYLENREPDITAYEVEGAGTILRSCGIFGCVDRFDPTAWYTAGAVLIAAAAAPFALAFRRR